MSLKLTVLGSAASALALILMGAAPASASNPQLNDAWASAKYVDLTDQLCARSDFGSGFYAIASIRLDGQVLWSKTAVGDGTNTWKCTANLSIPEDKLYTLVLESCTVHSNPRCTTKRTTFYS